MFKVIAIAIKTTTIENVHNRKSNQNLVKKHYLHKILTAVIIKALIRQQNDLLF